MKKPNESQNSFKVKYSFLEYFSDIVGGKKAVLKKNNTTIKFTPDTFRNWEEFAKVVAWFSRKDGKSTHFRQAKSKRSN